MRKVILMLSLALIALTSCEPDEIVAPQPPIIEQPPYRPPTPPVVNNDIIRTGTIDNMFIVEIYGNTKYILKVSSSMNTLTVSKEWYEKAKIGYTIRYREMPLLIYSINP